MVSKPNPSWKVGYLLFLIFKNLVISAIQVKSESFIKVSTMSTLIFSSLIEYLNNKSEVRHMSRYILLAPLGPQA